MDKPGQSAGNLSQNNRFLQAGLPEDFLFGVANSGYQVEGGYNQPGCPHNNFAIWEQQGRVEPTGDACRFWDRYDEHIERARSLGLNAFRLSIEWARVRPSPHNRPSPPPPIDEHAIDGYASIITKIMDARMAPIVTLHHFTHPAWCGSDLWLQEGLACLFVSHATHVLTGLNERVIRRGKEPIKYLITLNEPNILPLATYIAGEHPRKRNGFGAARRALDNMLLAHVLLYDGIHELYEQKGWTRPVITFNTFCTAIYEFDRGFFDLMQATSQGVRRTALRDYLARRRSVWNSTFADLATSRWGKWSFRRRYFLNYRFVCSLLFDLLYMRNTIDALYASKRKEKIDSIALDLYDPFVIGSLYIPSITSIKKHDPLLRPQWWDWHHDPEHFRTVLRAHHAGNPDLPIYIMETTIAHRQEKGGHPHPRRDGQGREDYLRWSIREVLRAIHEGIPVKGYIYWSLTDNYEWGSYEPRLGLYEYDYANGKILDRSGLGEEAGKFYGTIAAALRHGDAQQIERLLY